MSTTIDQNVVEMKFDNSHFEKNVSTTMSTLDKLKQKLHLPGATKGLEDVNSAVKNVDTSGLAKGVETVSAKFSAMQVIGVTALANITNSAVNAGKRIISALTIDPVKTGFSEYEMKMDSVKTIVNSTGRDLKDVNKLLEELNEYSDQTIYSFKDMTQNIGKFTNAGVELEDAVLAIKGISNEAAVSGANAQEASRAMYNFSQALSAGYVKLIDWKSIENANMATKEFKEQLIETAVELGVVTQEGDMYVTSTGKAFNATKNFNDTLQEQWMTTDVLITTLGKYADKNTEIGAKAFAAAQEVTKMTQMWDVLKETAQSGWAQTWELIVGDLNTAKKIFTPLTNFFSGIIDSMSDARNRVLQIALDFSKPWQEMANRIKSVADKVNTATSKVTGTLESFQDIVDRVWLGEYSVWGANPDRRDLLKEAGWDHRVVQELVNIGEASWHAGKRYQLSIEEVEAAHKKFGLTMTTTTDDAKDAVEAVNELVGAQLKEALLSGNYTESEIALYETLSEKAKTYGYSIEEVAAATEGLTGRQRARALENSGYTASEIDRYKEMEKKAEEAGKSIGELIKTSKEELALYEALEQEAAKQGISVVQLAEEMSNVKGRDLLIESFKNIGDIFVGLGKAIKSAWINIFNPPSLEVLGIRLYGIIRSLREFSESLRLTDSTTGELNETGLKFQSIFKGIFAAIDIVLTVVGGPLKIVFKAATQLLGYFGLGILDVAAFAGEALVTLRDFIEGMLDFTKLFDWIIPPIENAIETFRNWIGTLRDSEDLPLDIAKGIASAFGKMWTAIKDFFKSIPGFFKSIPDMLSGLFDGSKALPEWMGYFEIVGDVIGHLGNMIREKITAFLSRSEFAGISGDSIAGLVEGFKSGAAKVWETAVNMVTNLVQKVKDFLGIHSPSKVFIAIGGFIIAGLIAGLQNGIPDSLGAIKGVFQPMLDWIKGIDFGAILAGAVGIGSVVATTKIGNALGAFAAPFEGLGSIFEGTGEVLVGVGKVLRKSARAIKQLIKSTSKVVNSFSKVLDGVAFNMKMEGVRSFVISFIMLVAAIAVLSFFDEVELLKALGIVLATGLVLIGLMWLTDKVSKSAVSIGKDGINVDGLKAGLLGIAAAVVLMALAVKILGTLDPAQAIQGFLGLAGLIGAIGVVLLAFGTFVKGKSAQNIDKFGKTMTKMAFALLLMVAVIKLCGLLEPDDLINSLAVFGMFITLVALVSVISMIPAKNLSKMGSLMSKLTTSLLLMVVVIKLAAGLEEDELLRGVNFLIVFAGFVTLIALIGLIPSKGIDGLGKMVLSVAFSMLLLVGVVKLAGMLELGELIKGGAAVIAFGIIISLMVKSIMKNGSEAPKVAGTILAFSLAIAILAGVAIVCSLISLPGLAKGIAAVGMLSVMMWLMISATKGANDVKGNIIAITVAIGVLVAAVALLTLIDPTKLAITTGLVSVLMGMLALIIKVAGSAQKAMGALIALSGVVLILGGVLYLLADIPAEQLITSAIALGVLMLVMTGVLALMIPIGKMAKDAALGALALATLAVPLALFGLVLAMMSALNVTDAIPNVIALSVLCTVLTALLYPLSLIGVLLMASGGIILLGVAALLTMAVPLVAFVGILALMSMIPNAAANALALANLMSILGDVLFKISLVGPLAVVGVAALTAMIGLMTTMGVLATAIGALVTKFPQLQTFLDTGIDLLVNLAGGLGRVIGAFIAGIAGEVMTLLPQLGLCLSMFMTNVTPFIVGAKMIDESVLTGAGILVAAILAFSVAELLAGVAAMAGVGLVALGFQLSAFMLAAQPFITGASAISPEAMTGIKTLAEAILILTAADVLQGLTSLFTGGSSLEHFATQLPILGQGLAAFSTSLGTFTEDQLATVNCAAQAVKTLASAAAEIPNTGGLLASIVGENDLGVFAAQFPVLGTGLANFLTNIGTFSEDQVATVNCAAQAIKTLAQASKEIPNSGGWLGQIVGENDLGTFADQFPVLGSGLRGFLDNVGTFTEEQVATVDCAASAIKSLAQASSEIPNSGGWLGQIVGENDLETFAAQFPKLGTGLADFVKNVGTFSEDQVATVTCASNAVKSLAGAASSIPNQGGWLAKIVGDNDLGTFASNFPKLGEGLKGFADKLGTFSDDKLATVRVGVSATQAIAKLANVDLSAASKSIGGFSDKLAGLGTKISEFCSNMPDRASTTSAVANLKKILSAAASIADANSGALATFADNLKKIGTDAVDKFVGAFTSKSAKTDLEEAGKELANKVATGAEAKVSTLKTAGKNLVKGFAQGITDNTYIAEAKAKAMAKAAAKAAKDELDINSPSRVFRAIGYSVPEGFAQGIDKMGRLVTASSTGMAQNALTNVKRSISKIAEAVNTDIDSQPTIRPVLDLSDVRSGASALSSMLDMDSRVGVLANVGSISSMMNSRGQNGANDDVVSELAKLRKKMDNIGNTTNIINGVTYDDGSNINDAVATLVRAARIERRV